MGKKHPFWEILLKSDKNGPFYSGKWGHFDPFSVKNLHLGVKNGVSSSKNAVYSGKMTPFTVQKAPKNDPLFGKSYWKMTKKALFSQ